MTRSKLLTGEPSRGDRLRIALFGLLAAAMLLPSFDASAQDDEEDQAAQEEAAAAARAAAEERRKQQIFAELRQQIQQFRAREAELLQQKEAEARRELEEQQRLTQEQIARRDRAEARSQELDRQWEANEGQIGEITTLLTQHQGNLGELFGVTRQIAGDAAGVLRESLLSTQFQTPEGEEERAEFLVRMAAAKALPSITELERLWYELMREMKGGGEVVRYETEVIQLSEEQRDTELAAPGELPAEATTEEAMLPEPDADYTTVPAEVVRVGPFTVIRGNEFLGYLPSELKLTELDGQLDSEFRAIAGDLAQTPPDAGYARAVIDPASGALLGLYLQRPNWLQRIALGEAVGFVIITVGIVGVLLAIFQYGYLIKTRMAVNAQLRNLSQPRRDNPLGRLLLAFGRGNGGNGDKKPESAELAELRLSEAVLREIPKLQRFQAFLRLAVAAGPLLGLIGTVVGMIITFHAIVASGSSDPKLMAHGIGVAMIATVLGLGIAIPLLFINAGLTAFSRGITQVLDEQSEVLLAENLLATRRHEGA